MIVNFQVGVPHESVGKDSHMEHWLGSAAIVQTLTYDNICNQSHNVFHLEHSQYLSEQLSYTFDCNDKKCAEEF